MKKRYILMCFAGLLAITTVIGTTMAAFQTNTNDNAVSVISIDDLNIGICNENKSASHESSLIMSTQSQIERCMPGTVINEDSNVFDLPLVVRNEKSSGCSAFVRVRINKNWMENGLSNSDLNNYADQLVGEIPTLISNHGIMLEGWITKDWYVYKEGDEEYLYYRRALEPDNNTEVFLNKIIFSDKLNNSFAEKSAEIKIEADAIQALSNSNYLNVNKAAIEWAWDVDVTFNDSNEIVSITKKSN